MQGAVCAPSTSGRTGHSTGRCVVAAAPCRTSRQGASCRSAPAARGAVRVAAEAQAGGGGGSVLRQALTGSQRTKLDSTSDRDFYALPRFVKHVDDPFLRNVTGLYRQRIPAGGAVLDLCSSWVSHLPDDVTYGKVVGHGLNAAELARNPRLDSFFVRDLNKEPDGWAAADKSYDAVVCCVSVQYLQQPERVFAEIYRVLKPGGVVIMTFSNRMFYNKAIAAWRDASGYARCQLVRSYFQSVAGFTQPEVLTQLAPPPSAGAKAGAGNPVGDLFAPIVKLFERSSSDPFYAVIAYRNFKPE